jgi:phospholipid/cholesterol/gamma-HCH transport system substrate-binding protein
MIAKLPRRSPRRREVSKTTPRWVVLAVGAAGVVVLLALALIGYFAPNGLPLHSYYTLQGQFARADGLVSHTDVKLDGKRVGQVLHARIQNGHAVAELQLDTSIRPLRTDSTLRVRPRGLLGVVYVEIVPGQHGAPLADGARIGSGVGDSSSTVQLDDVLSTFDTRTRSRARTLLDELGKGVAGRGEQVNKLLVQAPAYVDDIAVTAAAVNARPGSPARFVHGAARAFDGLAPVAPDLAASLDPSARSFAPFADRADDWRASLQAAPVTLSTVRSGLRVTDPLLVSISRLSQQLSATLRPAPAAFRDTGAFMRTARPALRRVPPTLKLARAATDPTVTLAAHLNAQLPLVSATLKPALPIVTTLGPRTCDFRNFLGHWAGMDDLGDEGLNYLRASVTIGSDESLGTYKDKQPLTHSNPYPAPCEAGYEFLKNK